MNFLYDDIVHFRNASGAAGDRSRTRVIPERLRGVITTRRYTNPRLAYVYLSVDAVPRTITYDASLIVDSRNAKRQTLNLNTAQSRIR